MPSLRWVCDGLSLVLVVHGLIERMVVVSLIGRRLKLRGWRVRCCPLLYPSRDRIGTPVHTTTFDASEISNAIWFARGGDCEWESAVADWISWGLEFLGDEMGERRQNFYRLRGTDRILIVSIIGDGDTRAAGASAETLASFSILLWIGDSKFKFKFTGETKWRRKVLKVWETERGEKTGCTDWRIQHMAKAQF